MFLASLLSYRRAIAPIGLLFSGTLWLGNAAYLYLSVSFIQMLKVHYDDCFSSLSPHSLTPILIGKGGRG